MIIYKVTNLVNNKIYIGQSSQSLETRKSGHYRDMKREQANNRKSVRFHNALAKYSEESFQWEVIAEPSTQEQADTLEIYWIAYYKSNDRKYGYNLDSGGKSGGVKSAETKAKIGETTLKKWENPDTAEKMRDGLRKATVAWQKKCQNKLVDFYCPICGQTKKMRAYEARIHKTCSSECSNKMHRTSDAIDRAAERKHQANIDNKKAMLPVVLQWVRNNSDMILNCPFNNITSTLSELCEVTGLKDLRSLFLCFDDVNNKKELLRYLKDYLMNENIC